MAKVELINLDRDTLNLMQSSMNDFCNEFDVNLGDNESSIIDFTRRFNDPQIFPEEADPTWFGYLAIDIRTTKIVGLCGFEGEPDADGTVELFYRIFSQFNSSDYAYDIIQQLIAIACFSQSVKRITNISHLNDETSGEILARSGFQCLNEGDASTSDKFLRWILDVEDDTLEMVTVFSSCDNFLLNMAKSALDEAGIIYWVQGENPQNVYSPTILGFAYNPIVGPPQIKVSCHDAEKAKKILDEVLNPENQ